MIIDAKHTTGAYAVAKKMMRFVVLSNSCGACAPPMQSAIGQQAVATIAWRAVITVSKIRAGCSCIYSSQVSDVSH
jgi:hypothetical protein